MKFGADKIEYENGKIIVIGTTEIGKLKGVWKYREQPVVKYTYFIELSYEKFEKKISQSPVHNFGTFILMVRGFKTNLIHHTAKQDEKHLGEKPKCFSYA